MGVGGAGAGGVGGGGVGAGGAGAGSTLASSLNSAGVGGATNVEYIPYHICSSKTVLHRIYHDPRHPSYLLLPVIPNA